MMESSHFRIEYQFSALTTELSDSLAEASGQDGIHGDTRRVPLDHTHQARRLRIEYQFSALSTELSDSFSEASGQRRDPCGHPPCATGSYTPGTKTQMQSYLGVLKVSLLPFIRAIIASMYCTLGVLRKVSYLVSALFLPQSIVTP
ncbi:hypothetical protein CEXT_135711 [Caerostris extrusa]|uniref:Uncharacterized protein n=1 Tax=Caerostris extrusa TaxID=172846 RepID=A0AAV4MBP6_CAEEX|nr:hypothetical protein CEXT_135711 [Caerostris extrusa]